jgi:hypothetical protein
MLNHYLKLAWRSLTRDKRFSAINIFGLALGIATSLLILLWVRDERAVDAFHAGGPRLFQVYERTFRDGKLEAGYATQGLLADELKRVIPDVQYAAAFDYAAAPGTKNTLQVNDKITKMTGFFAGADFFRMFSFPLLQGRAETVLSSPGDIAVSRSLAAYLFGSAETAIGKTIRFEDKEVLRVWETGGMSPRPLSFNYVPGRTPRWSGLRSKTSLTGIHKRLKGSGRNWPCSPLRRDTSILRLRMAVLTGDGSNMSGYSPAWRSLFS